MKKSDVQFRDAIQALRIVVVHLYPLLPRFQYHRQQMSARTLKTMGRLVSLFMPRTGKIRPWWMTALSLARRSNSEPYL